MRQVSTISGEWVSGFDINRTLSDPYPLRKWQLDAYSSLIREKHRWLVAPPGSGKTTVMVAFAYGDLLGNRKKCLITVPQNSIKNNYKEISYTHDGEEVRVSPVIINTVDRLVGFLKSNPRSLNRRIAVCTHQAFCRVDDSLISDDLCLWVDEAHHLSADDSDVDSINRMGHKICTAIESGSSIGVATATPGRADNFTMILNDHRSDFVDFELTLERHIKEHTEIEQMKFDVLVYDDNPVECVSKVFQQSIEPTIIWLPNIQSISGSKYDFADEVASSIGSTTKTDYGWDIDGLVAVNLVDEKNRKGKIKFIKDNHVDVIISLDMFKEGDDYPKLSRCIRLGVVKSPTVSAQMNGRLYRHSPGKKKITVIQAIPEVASTKDIGKFMSSMLLSSLDISAVFVNRVKMGGKTIKSSSSISVWKECFDYDARSEILQAIYGIDDTKKIIKIAKRWCSGLTNDQTNRVVSGILLYVVSMSNCLNHIDGCVDLDIIESEDIHGWYSKAITEDDLRKIRKSFCDSRSKKNTLLKMAEENRHRIPWNHELHKVLYDYLHPCSDTFDSDFFLDLLSINSRWVDFQCKKKSDNPRPFTTLKKELMIRMAKAGMPRPGKKTPLGRAFSSYFYKSRPCYDPEFAQTMRECSDWYGQPKELEKTRKSKSKILWMISVGMKRPHKNSVLGRRFHQFVCRTSPMFDEKIRSAGFDAGWTKCA